MCGLSMFLPTAAVCSCPGPHLRKHYFGSFFFLQISQPFFSVLFSRLDSLLKYSVLDTCRLCGDKKHTHESGKKVTETSALVTGACCHCVQKKSCCSRSSDTNVWLSRFVFVRVVMVLLPVRTFATVSFFFFLFCVCLFCLVALISCVAFLFLFLFLLFHQVFILDSLAKYTPVDGREAEGIIERVTPRLQHANSAVVMSAVKVRLCYICYCWLFFLLFSSLVFNIFFLLFFLLLFLAFLA